jgi:hypothetical protein
MRGHVRAASFVVLNVVAKLRLHPLRLGLQILDRRVLLEDDAIIPVDLLFDDLHFATNRTSLHICNCARVRLRRKRVLPEI